MNNNNIKTISRDWLDPRKKIDFENGSVYQVGNSNVSKIYINDNGSFNVVFDGGIIISLTDVNYVEYFPNA